jgi:hypothetical protein
MPPGCLFALHYFEFPALDLEPALLRVEME